MCGGLRLIVRGSWRMLFIGLLLLAAAPVRADEEYDEEVHQKAQRSRQREAAGARELTSSLRLTRTQARRLLPLIEQAAAARLDAYELQARLLPEMVEAFTAFAREDSLNQGFSREVERRTARLNHRAKEGREKLAERLIELEKQAGAILSSSQRARAADFKPGRRPLRSRSRTRTNRHKQAEPDRLATARKQLSDLHKQLHPQPGPIGRYLLHPAAAERVYTTAGRRVPDDVRRAVEVLAHGTSSHPISEVDRQQAKIAELRTEINNWNLINGLHLSEKQIEQTVALFDAAVPTMRLKNGRIRRRASAAHSPLPALERSIEQVLNPGQRQVLADYKTCLIPPKNLKDPVRVGQASDNSRYEKWLSRARKAPADRLRKMIDEGLDREAEHYGSLSPSARKQRAALLMKTVRLAARMSDVDFQVNLPELAGQIAPPDRKKQLKDYIATLSRERGLPGVVSRHMLKPEFMEQLRLRGRQLAEGTLSKPVDLARGPQAENCDVSCAIDPKSRKKKSRK